MKIKKRPLFIGAAIVAAVILFTIAKPADEDERLPFDIENIQSDVPGEQDKITFTDGSSMTGAGFDLELVGTMVLPKVKPVFLFKSFSCRECEPRVNLIVFTAENREIKVYPYPGSHYLIGVEDSSPDLEDQIVEGIYGECGGTAHKILLAGKSREVESDGMTKRPSENWSFTFTTIEFTPEGKASHVTEAQDGFAKLPELISGQCLSLEPEDTHDYM